MIQIFYKKKNPLHPQMCLLKYLMSYEKHIRKYMSIL